MKKVLCYIFIFSLCACTNNPSNSSNETTVETNTNDMFTNRDMDASYNTEDSVHISLDGDTITSSSDNVQIVDSTITLIEETTYIISGTLNDGQILVDADENAKIQIVLDDATINSTTSAPIYVKEADKVFVTLANESQNILSNNGTFINIDENNIDAVIFSKVDLTCNGSGSLSITSSSGHGIVGKDDFVITGGVYSINCANHGIDANDSIRITNASLSITSGKDGMHAENTDDTSLGFIYIESGEFTIDAQGDGISASNTMQIVDGLFTIIAGGGSENGEVYTSDMWGSFMEQTNDMQETSQSTTDDTSTSMKAMKASNNLIILNGTYTLNSADDSLHANASITINDGVFSIASGDDGIHADETLLIQNGTINITESYEGLEALDIEIQEGTISIQADDDGINAAGGTDSSGMEGRDGKIQDGPMMQTTNGSIKIRGGNISITAYGDGIDANGSVEISGGYIVVMGPTMGDTSILDYDTSASITGGTFIGTGGSVMAQSFSSSTQGVIFTSNINQQVISTLTITDTNNNTILSYTPALTYSTILYSSDQIQSNNIYTVTISSQSIQVTAS